MTVPILLPFVLLQCSTYLPADERKRKKGERKGGNKLKIHQVAYLLFKYFSCHALLLLVEGRQWDNFNFKISIQSKRQLCLSTYFYFVYIGG